MPDFIESGRKVAEKWQFNGFFQNGGRQPSWIWWRPIWTTCEEYLVVFHVGQNLVGIDASVLIVWNFSFGLKTPIYAPKIVFWEYNLINWVRYQQNPPKIHPCVERRRMTHRSSKSVHRCGRDEVTEINKTKNPQVHGKLTIRREHPRRRIEMLFGMVGGSRAIVRIVKFHQNRFTGFRPVEVEYCRFPLHWPVAYQQLVLPYEPWPVVTILLAMGWTLIREDLPLFTESHTQHNDSLHKASTKQQGGTMQQTVMISRLLSRQSFVNTSSKWWCMAFVLAVVCLPIILSLEADAQPTACETMLCRSSPLEDVANIIIIIAMKCLWCCHHDQSHCESSPIT